MKKVILFGGQKGGTGKSSTAVSLAAHLVSIGKDVLLVDANPEQGTSSLWAEQREEADFPNVVCIEKSGNIHNSIDKLSEKYDIIIIDTGGQDSRELRTSAVIADILITTVRPSQGDLSTLGNVSALVDQARDLNPNLDARVLITQAPSTSKSQLLREAKEALQGLDGMKVMNTIIFSRKAYVDTLAYGLGVTELADKKARFEIELLAKEIGGKAWL